MSEIKYDDFTGFTFDGLHSSKFNIIVTSNGNRYSEDLFPSPKDNTIDMPRRDGLIYVSSKLQVKNFTLNIAYDKLDESQFRAMRTWLSKKELAPLIFDERPYKKYMVKASAAPKLNYICFDEDMDDSQIHLVSQASSGNNTQRIYKGEGSITFVCYDGVATLAKDSVMLNDYAYDNKNEWKDSSGLLTENVVPRDTEYYNVNGNTVGYLDIFGQSQTDAKYGTSYYGTVFIHNPGDISADFLIDFGRPAGNYLFTIMPSAADQKVQQFIINFSDIQTRLLYDHMYLDSKNNIFYGVNKDTGTIDLLGYAFIGEMPKLPTGDSIIRSQQLSESETEVTYKDTIEKITVTPYYY